jgi:hypothetical protein
MFQIKLTDRWENEKIFGLKEIDVPLFKIETTEKFNETFNLIQVAFDEGYFEDDDKDEKIDLPEILKTLPKMWPIEVVLEYFAINDGEFDLLSPIQGQLNSKQIALSIMELFEAYSDSDLYINAEEFPQTLEEFEELAVWLIKNDIIKPVANEEYKDGIFNAGAINALIENYNLLEEK